VSSNIWATVRTWLTPHGLKGLAHIFDWYQSKDAIIANSGSPTRLGNIAQRNTAPDVALLSPQLAMNFEWLILRDTLGSDHLPCLLSLRLKNEDFLRRNFSTRKWNLRKVDWLRYRTDISNDRERYLPEGPDPSIPPLEQYGRLIEVIEKALTSQGAARPTPKPHPRHRPQK